MADITCGGAGCDRRGADERGFDVPALWTYIELWTDRGDGSATPTETYALCPRCSERLTGMLRREP